MRISDLPERIKEIALLRRPYTSDNDNLVSAFNWLNTPEGIDIWREVLLSNFEPFYRFHNMTETLSQIEGFPEEVVEMMLTRQVEAGNPRNIEIFKRHKQASTMGLGFNWDNTIEGDDFWEKVISHCNFDLFFEKYPKKVLEFPRLMMVWNQDVKYPRVVIKQLSNGRYVCWTNAENIEDSIEQSQTAVWTNAMEMEDYVNLKNTNL